MAPWVEAGAALLPPPHPMESITAVPRAASAEVNWERERIASSNKMDAKRVRSWNLYTTVVIDRHAQYQQFPHQNIKYGQSKVYES
jgi:hypothetical protein